MRRSFEKTSKKLVIKRPFYGTYLSAVEKGESKEIDTACVSGNGLDNKLLINPEFWDSMSSDEQLEVLVHECLHLVFFHLSIRHKYKDKYIFNVAADIVVNQYLDTSRLPGEESDFITLSTFDHLNLKSHQGVDYYYKKIMNSKNNNDKKTQQILNNFADCNSIKSHALWEDFTSDSVSSADAKSKLAQTSVKFRIEEISKNMGRKLRSTLPGPFQEYLDQLLRPPRTQFDWRRYFKHFVAKSGKVYLKVSRRKFSRRLGRIPGFKIKYRNRVLCIIDTSGSMSSLDLRRVFGVVDEIKKNGQLEVDIIECDAKVHRKYKYINKDSINGISGRGGTTFDPAIEWANKHRRDYSSIIYLTDGFAPKPMVKSLLPLLWVVTSDGRIGDHLPGFKFKLNSLNEN